MDAEEALNRLKQAVAETAKSAQEHLDRGADPNAVVMSLLAMSDGLPGGVKVAQIGALGENLAEEDKLNALKELLNEAAPETLRELATQLQSLLPKSVGPGNLN